MNMSITPMTEEERKFSYTHAEEVMMASGCIGHLRGDMDSNGTGFFTSWDNHDAKRKTAAFKDEFDNVINALRFDEQYGGLLKNRSSLSSYCNQHPDSAFDGNYTTEYGFRVDTDEYSYLLRCNPNKGDYNFYIYAYERELLNTALQPRMNVLYIEPGEKPHVKTIGTDLASMQQAVGGYIQAVYPYEDPVVLICNEEAKLNGMELNRALRDEDGHIYDIVAGSFFIAGLGAEDFTSLPDSLCRKYSELFQTPEMFIRMDGKLVVLPLEEKRKSVVKTLNELKPQVGTVSKEHNHEKEGR